MPWKFIAVPLFAGLLMTTTAAAAAEDAEPQAHRFYVAPSGDDANPGTQEQPFATITAARDAVRELNDAALKRGAVVEIAGGTYRITEPITFGPEDSAPDGRPITYRAADPQNPPVISGGRVITGWKKNDDGTWSAAVPQVRNGDWHFRELFINGERRFRARHPNEGYARIVDAFEDQRSGFTFEPGDIPDGLDAAHGLELVFLHDWSISRIPVESIDHEESKLAVAHPIGPSADHYEIQNYEQHPRYFLENHPALLDSPGEWYLDTEAGVLTYKPMPGETIEDVEAVAPVATSLLEVRGKPGERVANLSFRGLHFQHCAWPIPEGGYAAGQAGFHEQRDGSGDGGELRKLMRAAVVFELAKGCGFLNGRIAHVGGSGIWFGSRTSICALEGTIVSDTGGNGVMIGEDRSRDINGEPWWKVAPKQAAALVRIDNNVIERPGQLFYGAVGIWVGMAQGTQITHNLIRNTPYTGISVGWMWNDTPTPCSHNQVAHNHIHHVMQTLSDGGGIYTLGRQPGTRLVGNVIHDVPLNAGRAESNGMFLDQGTAEIIIKDNLIYNIEKSPLRFHQAKKNLVKDNVLEVGENEPVVRYNATPEENITLKNNQIIPPGELKPSDYQQMIEEAGLAPEWRERLLGEE